MLSVVSLMFPYLLGLGLWTTLIPRKFWDNVHVSKDAVKLQLFASIIIIGVELNHLLVLVVGNLKQALVIGALFASVGYFCFYLSRAKVSAKLTVYDIILFVVLYLSCLFTVVVEPLDGWDGRCIWFFHGKIIFYNSSIDAGGSWTLPSLGYFHSDYPKMIPILAAQIAFVAGYWNEYLPKMSLVALLVPAILFIASILRVKSWHILYISFPFFFTQAWLKNGYVDGYFALYAGLAIYYLGRWLDNKNPLDLISGTLLTGVVLDLKNEGMLQGLIIASLFLIFSAIRIVRNKPWNELVGREYFLFLLVSVSGTIVWEIKKHTLGLRNDLQLGLGSLGRIQERLSDGSLFLVLKKLYIYENLNLSMGIFLICLTVSMRSDRRPSVGTFYCLIAAILYFCGLIMVYLATPYDLVSFHLPTGNRTLLAVHMILLAAAYSLVGKPKDSTITPVEH